MFTCISLELQVRTGSHRIPSTITIIPKKYFNASAGRNNAWAVMVGWFWGHKSKLCLEQIWHIFFTRGLQFITHLRFGPDFTVQPSPVLWYKVSPHKCQLKLGFSLFSDVQKCLEHIYPIILESWSQIWICHAVMIQHTWS